MDVETNSEGSGHNGELEDSMAELAVLCCKSFSDFFS